MYLAFSVARTMGETMRCMTVLSDLQYKGLTGQQGNGSPVGPEHPPNVVRMSPGKASGTNALPASSHSQHEFQVFFFCQTGGHPNRYIFNSYKSCIYRSWGAKYLDKYSRNR